MGELGFSSTELKKGKTFLSNGNVKNLFFSGGTYQGEVKDPNIKEVYWPFLQLDDQGDIIDAFCTCKASEKSGRCSHQAAVWLAIFQFQPIPIHVRFKDSLWNKLCQMADRRHERELKGNKTSGYEALSQSGKRLFHLVGKTAKGKKKIEEILHERPIETEETSLKFSNLSAEEIALWKKGRPSATLSYELSFWSDLAKWWMLMQEEGIKAKLSFDQEEKKLPYWIKIAFPDVIAGFYIAESNWPSLIPSLKSVDSPLCVVDVSDTIQAITYDSSKREFHFEFITNVIQNFDFQPSQSAGGRQSQLARIFNTNDVSVAPSAGTFDSVQKKVSNEVGYNQSVLNDHGCVIGDWVYIPKKGFFQMRPDSLLENEIVPPNRVSALLSRYASLIQTKLKGTILHLQPQTVHYHLHLDRNHALHLSCYLFKQGDLQQAGSAYFPPWVYVEEKGFFRLENALFDMLERIIPKEEVSDFVNRHRIWLQGFEGFQTHLATLESRINYRLLPNHSLQFENRLELSEETDEAIDFGDWIYVEGRGFFPKITTKAGGTIRGGLIVPQKDLGRFLRLHRDELEQISGFFTANCPIERAGLHISINEEGRIVVKPQIFFTSDYRNKETAIFGDFLYINGEGFSEIPIDKRLPEAFTNERKISSADEAYFVAYELDLLRPMALSIDPRLVKPKNLHLELQDIQRDEKWGWIVGIVYRSEGGTVPLYEVWKANSENRRYLFSNSGLVFLKGPRFQWLRSVTKKKWIKGGKQLRLSTLEWLRMSVYEEVIPPKEEKARILYDELKYFRSSWPIDLKGLQSVLRPYQEAGLKWLWFLYTHALSGLLCDEMGLGKTHQAMALIAAVYNRNSGAKFLVVCPTSVIYHWEGLLRRFFPTIRVSVFYGIQRSLAAFATDADLLLTSYGTLRSEQKALSQIPFDVAVYDEVQIAKNVYSQTHRALKKMKSRMVVGLTGTPIENRLLELKALFDLILPNYLPAEKIFREIFITPIEKNQDPERKILLNRLIQPFILRRKKGEVLTELPEKVEEVAYCDLSEEQRSLYRKAFEEQKRALMEQLLDGSKPAPYLHIFSLLSTLKQICDHPCLITKNIEEFEKHHSGKWDLFVELLQEARDSGQKLVVFSQYLDMLNIIELYLKQKGIGFAAIRGSTRDRKSQIEKFRDDPTCEVFVGSLQASGVGIDLVAASVVIHYDRWWNPAKENQATDRVHRIGQNRNVQVFKMVTKGTIEERIHDIIESKLVLLEGVIGFDDQDHIKGLEREEFIELFRWIDLQMN